jgi:hypothetical protein
MHAIDFNIAVGAHYQQRRARDMACHIHEQVKCAAIRVVQVLEDKQQRLSSADVSQAVEYPAEQPQPIILRVLGRAQLDLEPASESWHDPRDLACARAKLPAQRLGVALACKGFEGFDERLIRDAGGALWIAMADECESALNFAEFEDTLRKEVLLTIGAR